jgi:hypothetical protein
MNINKPKLSTEETQALIEKLFNEKLDEEVLEINPYDFGTFTVETVSGKSYYVGDEMSCRRLAIQETEDLIDDVFDDESLLKLLDETWYRDVDDRVIDVALELYDPENEMPELWDIEYFHDFREQTGLGFTNLMDYGLDADMVKPYIDYRGLSSFIVDEDGIENTLARYDGKEVWLGNMLYAYRVD